MRFLCISLLIVFVTACYHPLEISGNGDIRSSTGDRDCTSEEGLCSNYVTGEYKVTYRAEPREGWVFAGWERCGKQFPECSFNVADSAVAQFEGYTLSSLKAHFIEQSELLDCNGKAKCTESMVRLSVADASVRGNILEDNTSTSWSPLDEKADLEKKGTNFYCSDGSVLASDVDSYLSLRPNLLSHALYAPDEYSLGLNADDFYTSPSLSPLGSRKPLILIHGWQGDEGDNNYLCHNAASNRPEDYFEEMLAFFDVSPRNLKSKYKLFVYKYPTFEHITFNGRILGEMIALNSELKSYIDGGGKITIIAHSMGGLVARSLIEEWGLGVSTSFQTGHDLYGGNGHFVPLAPGESVVDKLITLGTPHHGSPLAGTEWVDYVEDLAPIANKERKSPGALDTMWDNFDYAVEAHLGVSTLFEFYHRTCPESAEYTENVPVCWPSRAGVRAFDIAHGGEQPISAGQRSFPTGKRFFHPNPWLRKLNQALFIDAPATQYIFYSGGVLDTFNLTLDDVWIYGFNANPLNSSWNYNAVAESLEHVSKMALNDGAVPSSSAFLDEADEWASRIPYYSSYLWNQDFSTLRFAEFQEQSITRRYLHDYDHGMMRGGSGYLYSMDRLDEHNSNYRNSYNGNYPDARVNTLVQMGITPPVEIIDNGQEFLEFEPLFNSLGKEIDYCGIIDSNDGLLAHYSFDGPNADDVSGYDNHGVVHGAEYRVSGCQKGRCFYFDGSGDYVEIPDGLAPTPQSDPFSVSFYVALEPTGDYQTIFGKTTSNSDNRQITINAYPDLTKIAVHIGGEVTIFKADISDNRFHSITLTVPASSSGAKFYLDGRRVTEITKGNGSIGLATNDKKFVLGRESLSERRFTKGLIDEVRMYSRVLSPEEICR